MTITNMTGQLIPGTAFRCGQRVAYGGSIRLLSHPCMQDVTIIGPKRRYIVVAHPVHGEFDVYAHNLVAMDPNE